MQIVRFRILIWTNQSTIMGFSQSEGKDWINHLLKNKISLCVIWYNYLFDTTFKNRTCQCLESSMTNLIQCSCLDRSEVYSTSLNLNLKKNMPMILVFSKQKTYKKNTKAISIDQFIFLIWITNYIDIIQKKCFKMTAEYTRKKNITYCAAILWRFLDAADCYQAWDGGKCPFAMIKLNGNGTPLLCEILPFLKYQR